MARSLVIALTLTWVVTACGGADPMSAMGEEALATFPGGVYVPTFGAPLLESNDSVNPTFAKAWSSANVKGFSIRVNWSTIEPAQAASAADYDWSSLTKQLAALPAGKHASVVIHAGAGTPSWFCSAHASECVTMHHYDPANSVCVNGTFPIPFTTSTHYVSRFKALIQSMGAMLTANPTLAKKVAYLKLGGVVAFTDEIELPYGLECGTYDETAAWQALGYTSSSVFSVWKTFVSAFASAAPGQYLAIPIALGFPPIGETSQTLTTKMVNDLITTYGQRAIIMGQGLKDAGGIQSQVETAPSQGGRSGMQEYIDVATHTSEMIHSMCYPADASKPNLIIRGMVDFAQGIADGACNPGKGHSPLSFFEIYASDVNAFDSVINGVNVIAYANQHVAP